jgi:hypothetical protein
MRKLVTVPGGDFEVYNDVDINKPTGFMITDAILYLECPRCHSKPRFVCRTPSGKKTKFVHADRTKTIANSYYITLTDPSLLALVPKFDEKQAEKDAKKLFKEMKNILGDLF